MFALLYFAFLPRDARSASAVLLSYIVRPSVRPSVTLMYAEHIGWTSSKLVTRIISLGSSLLGAENRQPSPSRTSTKFGWNKGGVVLSRKPAISLKRGKIGPRLQGFDWCQNQRPCMVDLEGPLRTVLQNTCVFRSPPRKFE